LVLGVVPAVLGLMAALLARSQELFMLGLLLTGAVVLVSVVMELIGRCMLCTIPRESGGRGWALCGMTCLILTVLGAIGLVVIVIAGAGSLDRRAADVFVALFLLGLLGLGVVGFVGSLGWAMTLRAAARFWGEPGLGAGFLGQFIFSWVVSVGIPVIQGVLAAATGAPLLNPGLGRAGASRAGTGVR